MFAVITRVGFETRNCFHGVQEPESLTMQTLYIKFRKESWSNSQTCCRAAPTQVVGNVLWGQVTLAVPFQMSLFTSSSLLTQVVWGVHFPCFNTMSAYENFTTQPSDRSKSTPPPNPLTLSASCVILLDIFPSILWRRLFIFLLWWCFPTLLPEYLTASPMV